MMWSWLQQSEEDEDKEYKEIRAMCDNILNEEGLKLDDLIEIDLNDMLKENGGTLDLLNIPSQCRCMEIKEEEIPLAFPKKEPVVFLDQIKAQSIRTGRTVPGQQSRHQAPIVTVNISDDEGEEQEGKKYEYRLGSEVLGQGSTSKANLHAPFRSPQISSDNALPPRIGLSRRNPNQAYADESSPSLKPEIDEKLLSIIKDSIMVPTDQVNWDDISGLEYPKKVIEETIILPQLRPDLFKGLRRPSKGILLFGPPGTGKTMIGKCIAAQSKSKFFSISASTLVSKWMGEGEKLVRALFSVAQAYQPSVIFVDEIDSLLSARSDQENEGSRRLKTEFLVRLDGAGTSDDDRVLIIGATNRPQDLDDAARRRLVKRLYIPLPDQMARRDMFRRQLMKVEYEMVEAELDQLAQATDGYSGADIKTLCNEAALGPIRDIPMDKFAQIAPSDVRPVLFKDFEYALKRTKASVDKKDLEAYVKWDSLFGSGFN